MPAKKYDYRSLEREFVRGSMSIRELARQHSITSVNAIHVAARRKDAAGRTWYDKRKALQSMTTTKALEILSDREAIRQVREATVLDDALDAVGDGIANFRSAMSARQWVEVTDEDGEIARIEQPLHPVGANEMSRLLDRLNTLTGRPSNISEERSFGVHITGDATPEDGASADLVRVVELARQRSGLAHGRAVGASPFAGSEELGSEPQP